MKKTNNILLGFATILLLVAGIVLISGCIGEEKDKGVTDESGTESITDSGTDGVKEDSGTESTKEQEPNTWLFKGTLTSKDDSNTYKIDLRDKPLGGMLIIEYSPGYYTLMLTDSNEMPLFEQYMQGGGSKETKNAVVDGGEIYYLVVKPWGGYEENKQGKQHILNIEFIPHSSHNSPDTAIPLTIPGKFDGKIVSGKDVNYFGVGPVNTSGLLVVDFSTDNRGNFKIELLDDKAGVIQEGKFESKQNSGTIRYPVDKGNVYYVKVGGKISYGHVDFSFSYSINTDLTPNSINSNPDNAIPIQMSEIVEGKIVSPKDVNWFKLDLRDYSNGEIIINLGLPDGMFEKSGYMGYVTMELLEENKINIVGSAKASLKEPSTFKKEIKGGNVYYIKIYTVYTEHQGYLYHPTEPYKLEVKSVTMMPRKARDEKSSTYTLASNTADTAITVNIPAHVKGKISSEDDVQWFNVDLGDYSNGGTLTVTFTMPTKTGPSCAVVCNQPVCFNLPKAPSDCYHYKFEVFESDKITKVMEGSAAPDDEIVAGDDVRGDLYYFKISAPHGRYNTEESYTIDVRFSPDK